MAESDIPADHFFRKCRPRRGGLWRHGLSDSPLEGIYENIKDRCYNPNAVNYKNYGAKGIAICEQWLGNPGAFYEWALANGYQEGLQIDRKDNGKGYAPENCCWRTHQQNQNNRSNNTRLEYDGQNLTLAEWSRHTGIKRTTLSARHHNGWKPAEVLGFARRKT